MVIGLERRRDQRFDVDSLHERARFRVKGLYDVRFLDFSERGFAFSSSAMLSIGDYIELELTTNTQEKVSFSALVCNRTRESFSLSRYGVFFDGLSALSEDHNFYMYAIGCEHKIIRRKKNR